MVVRRKMVRLKVGIMDRKYIRLNWANFVFFEFFSEVAYKRTGFIAGSSFLALMPLPGP